MSLRPRVYNQRFGEVAIAQTRKVAASAGLVSAVICAGLRPRSWARTVREAWIWQVVNIGVNSLGIICFLALSLGVLLCVQYEVLVGQFNQSQILPLIFVVSIVRELGPLLVNFVLIARSGNAIATELALMQVSGEVRVIEGQGIDHLAYLVLPRVLAFTFSVICLTVIFIAAALLGVYLCGEWIGTKTGNLGDFANAVLILLTPADAVNLILKSIIPPMITGSVCCMEGLNGGESIADVPAAGGQAVQRSIVILFATSALISAVTYLR
jgi:phospholipid/cholesterol/gamma-HCH transport system permease protein